MVLLTKCDMIYTTRFPNKTAWIDEIVKDSEVLKLRNQFVQGVGNIPQQNVLLFANYIDFYVPNQRDKGKELALLYFLETLKAKAEQNAINCYSNFVKLLVKVEKEDEDQLEETKSDDIILLVHLKSLIHKRAWIDFRRNSKQGHQRDRNLNS